MKKIVQYLKDVRTEVAKVNWPTKDDVKGATILVIVLSCVFAVYVFACDQALQAAVGLFLSTR
ncbi:MAG: preprotein translocase subunit SecE [Chitinispirillales bacterium]|jgi:preprotein translocase subunit SecE|nr:preprotein translocase subunit SecE [Chitinispirillales bacterium]